MLLHVQCTCIYCYYCNLHCWFCVLLLLCGWCITDNSTDDKDDDDNGSDVEESNDNNDITNSDELVNQEV